MAIHAREVLRQGAFEYELGVITGKVAGDHGHLILMIPPKVSDGFGTLKLTHLEGKRQPKIDPPKKVLW